MAIIKCKMCGGDLEILEGSTVCECAYCGTRQTVPSMDNEKKLTLFGRAGRLLRGCEFDKAAGVFETIVADFPEEAEAYWGLVLCKYGIEYVDDPASGRKIPTCHRSSFESVLDDPNFEQACENTDAVARRVYRDEARAIEALREQILAVSGREEPYDVFISYKETDESGERTLDSVLAQDIYKALTDEGYRVFFSRISLEDKLGTEYEPYIFAALNSAKVMLAVGTDYENYDSVWVKNEWSRFLKLIAKGEKKTLIPVFKNMDAYDMPKEFAKLAAQDMGKVGAMQDLLRGVEKIIAPKKAQPAPAAAQQPVYVSNETDAKALAALKRGDLALEDREWDKAREFYDQTLALDAECAEAYLGLALAEDKSRNETEYVRRHGAAACTPENKPLPVASKRIDAAAKEKVVSGFLDEKQIRKVFAYDGLSYKSSVAPLERVCSLELSRIDQNRNFSRAARFAGPDVAERLQQLRSALKSAFSKRIEAARQQEQQARDQAAAAYEAFLRDAEQKAASLQEQALKKREDRYASACEKQEKAHSIAAYREAIREFQSTGKFKDRDAHIRQCEEAIEELEAQAKAKAEAEAKAAAEQAERDAIAKKAKQKKIKTICAASAAAAAVLFAVFMLLIRPAIRHSQAIRSYETAQQMEKDGNLAQAAILYGKAGDYEDARSRSFALWDKVADRSTIAAGGEFTLAVKQDGTVLGTGVNENHEVDVHDWTDIVAVSAGYDFSIGLRADGTVVATGNNEKGQCNVSKWTDIVAIEAGSGCTFALRSDGTVVCTGKLYDSGMRQATRWKDIISVKTDWDDVIGLKADGTVVAAGENDDGECDVTDWTDIKAISTGSRCTVGLKQDGTVVATKFTGKSEEDFGQCRVAGLEGIEKIYSFDVVTVGLRENGTLVGTSWPSNRYLSDYLDAVYPEMLGWKDIVAVAHCSDTMVGLRDDGTLVAYVKTYDSDTETYGTTTSDDAIRGVSEWKNIKLPNRG